MLDTGVNAALFENEKTTAQALFCFPSATTLSLGHGICLNSRSACWPERWMEVLCITGGCRCSE